MREVESVLDSIETEAWRRKNSLDSSEGPIRRQTFAGFTN